jgi:hypothetical protein
LKIHFSTPVSGLTRQQQTLARRHLMADATVLGRNAIFKA